MAHHIFIAASKRTILEQSEQLQRTMRNRDRMYSVIAHDLRSPIGTLKMVFNMLTLNITEQMAGAENIEMLKMGNDITENTFMLLDNLLKWTKSQTGRMNTVFQEVDLAEVVLFAGKIADLVASAKGITVEYELPASTKVRCDVDMIKTIVRNLLSNAIKFSHEGGRVIVSMSETATHVLVSVRDFGKGIRQEDQSKVLDPDVHFTDYGTRNEEGSGLGLQLCSDLTRRNGGELTFVSKEGEGSTFTFSVAKSQAADQPSDRPVS